ncbi:hypothetical protein llap_18978 [Limosa lapponica baueri]|uniref:Uncharacterized protein n=1 Tax=Limosa lapponica baueri TaxID=1758121 RepID=A0A2I0TA97_LIMLA|nr:hypothetical protein llap_18978 [Limosa lapponica baueri]
MLTGAKGLLGFLDPAFKLLPLLVEKRMPMAPADSLLLPGHYNINNSLIKVSPKGITSCFKSETSRLTRMERFTPEPATCWPQKPTKGAKKTPFREDVPLFMGLKDIRRPTVSPGPTWPVIATGLQELPQRWKRYRALP